MKTFTYLLKAEKKKINKSFLKSTLHFYADLVAKIKSLSDFINELFDIISVFVPKGDKIFTTKSQDQVVNRFSVLKKCIY